MPHLTCLVPPKKTTVYLPHGTYHIKNVEYL